MSITLLRGLFYNVNGSDKPLPLNKRYGPIQDGGGPLFLYSVSNIMDAMITPHIVNLKPDRKTGDIINILTDGTVDQNVKDHDFTGSLWEKIADTLLDIEELGSLLIDMSAHDPNMNGNYITEGELKLRNMLGILYVENSADLKVSNIDHSRLKSISFTVRENNEYVELDIYFTPDDFMDEYGLRQYRVYNRYYELLSAGEPTDNVDEWDQDIVSHMMSIEVEDNYVNYEEFTTTKVDFDTNGVEIKRYLRSFFIFMHMQGGVKYNRKMMIIKSFLESKHTSNNIVDYDYLVKNYPDIFTNMNVDVFLMVNNRGKNGDIATPICNTNVSDLLTSFGVTSNEYNKVEMLLLEGLSAHDIANTHGVIESSMFNIPLLVYESGLDVGSYGPITKRFRDFRLRYGQEITGSPWETFHFYLKISLKICLGMIAPEVLSDAGVVDGNSLFIPDEVGMEVVYTNGAYSKYVSSVSFSFMSTRYNVHSFKRYTKD